MVLHIPDHLRAFVEREVAAGYYPDENAVIVDALERLAEEHDGRVTVAEAVAESLAQMERGEVTEATDEFWNSLSKQADEDARLGIQISDDVKYSGSIRSAGCDGRS